MKVLHVHDKEQALVANGTRGAVEGLCSWRGGGLAVYLSQLIRGSRERGWDAAVVALSPNLREDVRSDNGFYRLRAFRYRFRASTVASLTRIVERENPDIIHLHSIPTLHPALMHPLGRARPVLWMFHDVTPICFRGDKLHPGGRLCTRAVGFGCVTSGCYRPGESDGFVGDFIRVLSHRVYLGMYRRTPAIMVPSSYLKDQLTANGLPPERIRVVPLFSRFHGAKAPSGVDEGPARILFVGRLSPEKGILQLTEALARLADEPWTATVVGDGPTLQEARRLAGDHGLEERITFVGEAADAELQRHYRSCSFVVLPSLVPESFGMVGVEAMSFGKPVIAFESGGVTEWLEHGMTGFLVRRGDIEQLADHIRLLIRDARLRERLGEAGYRKQHAAFTIDRHLDRVLPLYRELIENGAGGSR